MGAGAGAAGAGMPGADGCDIQRAEQAYGPGAAMGDAACAEGLTNAAAARETLLQQSADENSKALKLWQSGSSSGTLSLVACSFLLLCSTPLLYSFPWCVYVRA